MAIVPTNVPMTAALCDSIIQQIIQAYPFCRSEILTTTAYDRPVRTLVIGTGDRKLICTASHHANEWITTTALLKFAEEYADAVANGGQIFGFPAAVLAETTTLYMVPMVNPDGVDLVTGAIEPGTLQYEIARSLSDRYPGIPFPDGWKANLMGVDLNLNYPAGWLRAREIKFSQGYNRPGPRDYVGRSPLNQRETIALAGYTEWIDPALVIALHTQGNVIYWQFDDIFVPGARELAEQFAQVSGYQLEEEPYNSSFAGYKDWFIQYFRRPGFTIEAGSGQNPLPLEQFDDVYSAVLGILVTALAQG